MVAFRYKEVDHLYYATGPKPLAKLSLSTLVMNRTATI